MLLSSVAARMPHKGLLLLVVVLCGSYAHPGPDGDDGGHGKKDDFDWTTFIIGSSCSLESLGPDGTVDHSKSEACGNCIGRLGSAAAEGQEGQILSNCSQTFLPNIAETCSETLEKKENFYTMWEEALECFYGYVVEKDVDGKVQRSVKEWMKYQEEMEENWKLILATSCLVESRMWNVTRWKEYGEFDFDQFEMCAQCFEAIVGWGAEEFDQFQTCTEEFLPRMTSCNEVVAEDSEEMAVNCFHEYNQVLDVDEKAREMVKGWFKDGMTDSWTSYIANMVSSVWQAVTTWW